MYICTFPRIEMMSLEGYSIISLVQTLPSNTRRMIFENWNNFFPNILIPLQQ